MAKRKRLSPPDLDTASVAIGSAPEVKSAITDAPVGIVPDRFRRPPIADVAQDASASAALTELAQTMTTAREEGRLIQPLPLDQIQADYLVRDRIETDADEMETLKESLRHRGQQTAIEVTALDDGSYGLISGWRRVAALRTLAQEDLAINTVLAIVRQPAEAADAYLAMVEENEIRVGLSYFERARIVARAVDAGVYTRDRVGLSKLFHAASRSKRSKIGSFLKVVRALGDDLYFPRQLTERNGLALAQALDADAAVAQKVRVALQANPPADAATETQLIAAILQASDGAGQGGKATVSPASSPAKPAADWDVPTFQNLHVRQSTKGDIILSGALLEEPGFKAALVTFLTKQDTI